jgi:hypothetical protein
MDHFRVLRIIGRNVWRLIRWCFPMRLETRLRLRKEVNADKRELLRIARGHKIEGW